jgi:1,4-alpha-glucan branching enzyme
MKATCDKPRGNPYSAKNMAKPVSFFCAVVHAQMVCLVGDFNEWNPTSLPMQRQADGSWYLQVPLTHGHHEYLFLVDGIPVLDPNATGTARNERNELVSLMAVS